MIELKLSTEEVNSVLTALGNMPYIQVRQLIDNVMNQARAQVEPPQQPVTGELVDG